MIRMTKGRVPKALEPLLVPWRNFIYIVNVIALLWYSTGLDVRTFGTQLYFIVRVQ